MARGIVRLYRKEFVFFLIIRNICKTRKSQLRLWKKMLKKEKMLPTIINDNSGKR
jgi:hypothetical protein